MSTAAELDAAVARLGRFTAQFGGAVIPKFAATAEDIRVVLDALAAYRREFRGQFGGDEYEEIRDCGMSEPVAIVRLDPRRQS